MRRWGFAALVALLGACAEFDDPSTIKDLRLLAVALDPSEVILDPASPGAALSVRLRPLAVDGKHPSAPRPLSFSLRACANNPLAPNAPGSGSTAAGNYPAGGARSSVGSARCPAEGPTSWTLPLVPAPDHTPAAPSFVVSLTAEQIAAAFAVDVFPGHLGNLHGGFDLGLPITFDLTASAGDESASGLKRLIVWKSSLAPTQRPNENPAVAEVVAYRERDPHTRQPVGDTIALAPDIPLSVSAEGGLWLEPRGASAEPYFTTVVDRFTDQVRVTPVPKETLRFSFFATAGKFEPRESTSELGFAEQATSRVPLEARYVAPAVADWPADPTTGDKPATLGVRIFIVVRDERGGASWVERALTITR